MKEPEEFMGMRILVNPFIDPGTVILASPRRGTESDEEYSKRVGWVINLGTEVRPAEAK